jgi:hypothetical protein
VLSILFCQNPSNIVYVIVWRLFENVLSFGRTPKLGLAVSNGVSFPPLLDGETDQVVDLIWVSIGML